MALRVLGRYIGQMRLNQTIPQVAIIVNRVPILARLPTTQRIAILPEHITTGTRRAERRRLPGQFHGAIVIVAEFFQNARFVQRGAHLGMILDPRVTPALRRRDRPGVWVQVVGAEVDRRDCAVSGEIRAFGEGVRVASVAWEAEAFFARRDHVLRIQTFDVCRCGGHPVRELGRRTTIASGLIGEFPGEDRRRVGVARHDGFDVGLVLGLGFGGVVPLGVRSDAGVGEVGAHAAVVSPVICEVLGVWVLVGLSGWDGVGRGWGRGAYNDQLNPMRFSGFNDVVKTLETVRASVDACDAVDEGLVVDCACARDAGHVVETPDSEDFFAGGLEVLHHGVDVGIVGQEADPVGIGAGIVLLLAVYDEGGAAGCRDGAGGSC